MAFDDRDRYKKKGKAYYYEQPRSSMLGKTEQEIYKYFTTKDEMDEDTIPIMSAKAGTALHRLTQAQQYKLGNIETAEKMIHNKNFNFTGHIDAISSSLGIGDIKTVSRRMFKKIKKYGPKASHITQVNAYMMTTGTEEGYIQYIMREDPSRQVVFKLTLDRALFKTDMEKVSRVQERIKKELASGKLSHSQMRQGSSLDVLEEEDSLAHSNLQEDASNIENLVTDFLSYQHKLDKKTGEFDKQKISYSSRFNEALNPQARREDQNTIEGMNHGWFGSMRSAHTDFGSAWQAGKFHSIGSMTNKDIKELLDRQMGIDFETRSLTASRDSVFQVAVDYGRKGGKNRYGSYFLKQTDNNLTDFLEHRSGIGSILKKKLGIDFTKEGKIPDYTDHIFNEKERRTKRIYAEIINRKRQEQVIREVFTQAKSKKMSIMAWNANFEADQTKHVIGDNSANLSPEFRKLTREARAAERLDLGKLRINELTKDQVFTRKVARQEGLFVQMMNELQAGKGNYVDLQEAGKTLQATAQKAGLVKKTGEFGTGTSIELLSKIFLKESELHEGVADLATQRRVADRALQMIRDISSGKITRENAKGGQARYLKAFNEDIEKTWLHTMERKVTSELDSRGHLMEIDPSRKKYIGDFNLNQDSLFKKAQKNILGSTNPYYAKYQAKLTEYTNTINKVNSAGGTTVKGVKYMRTGIAVGAGLAVLVALKNAFRFSGRDDDSNTIEGLKHGGLAGAQRRLHTDFGSGYRTEDYHNYTESKDPTDTSYMELMAVGAIGVGMKAAWNEPFGKTKIDDLPYLGRLAEGKLNSEVLGRTQATIGDAFISTVKRGEAMLGGLPRSFGISDLLGSSVYDSAEFSVDLGLKKNESYAQYINSLVKRNLVEEGVDSVTFSKGKLILNTGEAKEVLKGKYSLVRLSHDLNQHKSMTQFSKAVIRMSGGNFIDPTMNTFLPIGGEGILGSSAAKKAHAYFHETFSKYAMLMDNPLAALRELFPDVNIPGTGKKLGAIAQHIPGFGVGGEKGLIGPTHKMVGRHLTRLGIGGAALYFGYGTLDWAARKIGPNDTVMGDAGLTGLGAEAIRTGHQTYARLSDVTGMTSLRDSVDEMTPGMEGWQASVGLGLSGGLAGLAYGVSMNLASEATSVGAHYDAFLAGKKNLETAPDLLRKIPGLTGEYSKVSKYGRLGLFAGLAASVPWLIAGAGADKSYDELEEEYEGRSEVEVRRGRFWEASMTPWGGDKIDYYRPNWYARMRDDAKTAELYEGQDISPIGKLARSLIDPNWLEKRRYEDQPYPYSGPDGSAMGIFGPLYEATLGRALKAPVRMHEDEFNAKVGGDYITADSSGSLLRKQWNSIIEAMGLRGFGLGTLKEAATGEMEVNSYEVELASASNMDSLNRDLYDLQLGGGILTTEALRRVFPREHSGSITRINPLENKMPSWMPEDGYYINFHEGDPFSKVKEGYYRLPGEGFATRYEELKGIDPEDYPDIYKYKILGDVASGSMQFAALQTQLEKKTLTADELGIWNQVNSQIKEKEGSALNLRDPQMYETILGRYGAFVTDLARANPVEQLTPISPAHKFLPGQDPVTAYEEELYGKSFKRWGSPFEDFVAPAVRMGLNSIGMAGAPEDVTYARQLEDHFDKLEYMKSMRLAEEARATGDTGTANLYQRRASGTMSGVDPYADQETVLKALPKREREYFKKFADAPVEDRRRILETTAPTMRDIYLAQWDKKAVSAVESGEAGVGGSERVEMLQGFKTRASQVRARRKGQIQDFSNSDQVPGQDWEGWNKRSSLEDVKMKYLLNEGRDYHYYGMWRDRMNKLSRKPHIDAAAENMTFSPQTYENKYSRAHEQARSMGVIDPHIAILPGIESGVDLEVQQDRSRERRSVLRDLGHVL